MASKTRALRDWTEDEGTPLERRALVVQGPASYCAYVGVPSGNPLAGQSYHDMPLECHGGLTFSDEGGCGQLWPEGWYWYGWDYAHHGDFLAFAPDLGGHMWTVDEVEAEARKVMDQLSVLLSEVVAD